MPYKTNDDPIVFQSGKATLRIITPGLGFDSRTLTRGLFITLANSLWSRTKYDAPRAVDYGLLGKALYLNGPVEFTMAFRVEID